MEHSPARPDLPRTECHARAHPPSPPALPPSAKNGGYHYPGDIIIYPGVRAADAITREPTTAYSWPKSDLADLLCWGPRNRQEGRVCRNGRRTSPSGEADVVQRVPRASCAFTGVVRIEIRRSIAHSRLHAVLISDDGYPETRRWI